jgi:hypothetical protein
VITFEEAWPLAEALSLDRGEQSKIDALISAAVAIKNKDAAGLGALAFAYHEGDASMESQIEQMRHIRLVSEALDRPKDFFGWALEQCTDESQRRVVLAAQKYFAAATWGWDKTCILAGALLAIVQGVPRLARAIDPPQTEFPFWVALDKHTPRGKEALRNVADRLGQTYRRLIWASFYVESTVTNSMSDSPWWEREKRWRLQKAGLTIESAIELWEDAWPLIRDELAPDAAELRSELEGPAAVQKTLF